MPAHSIAVYHCFGILCMSMPDEVRTELQNKIRVGFAHTHAAMLIKRKYNTPHECKKQMQGSSIGDSSSVIL